MPELSPEMQATVLGWAVSVAKAVGLLIVVWLAGGWARRATTRGLERARFDATLSKFFSGMARWVVLVGLGGSSVDWQVRIWAEKANFSAVKQATIRAVKLTLDQAGIGIPFPQMDVHLDRLAQNQA